MEIAIILHLLAVIRSGIERCPITAVPIHQWCLSLPSVIYQSNKYPNAGVTSGDICKWMPTRQSICARWSGATVGFLNHDNKITRVLALRTPGPSLTKSSTTQGHKLGHDQVFHFHYSIFVH